MDPLNFSESGWWVSSLASNESTDSNVVCVAEGRRERRQMTVYIIVVVIVIIVGSLWLWGPAKVFGTLFFWWLDSDDD